MREFKAGLKKKLVWLILETIFAIALVVGSNLAYSRMPEAGEVESFVSGFQFGLLCAWVLMMVWSIITYAKALRSEDACKKLYIKEHDERTLAIQSKIGNSGYWTTLMSLIIGAVVAGFFNLTVFVTLVAVVGYMLIVGAIQKAICYRTM